MSALLGHNDAKNVVIALTPPVGPLGILLVNLVLGVLPDGAGFTFPYEITGKMSGQYASAQRNVALNTMTAGADGKVNVNTSHDKSGTYVLTLMQNAPSVSLLNALLIAQEAFNTLPVFDCSITDLNSGAKYSGNQCVVQGYAPRTFASDASASMEYTILISELTPIEIALPVFG